MSSREIEIARRILENAGYKISRPVKESTSYENYTEDQFEETLDNIEGRVGEISSELRDIPYDDRGELLAELEDLSAELYAMDEYLSDALYDKKESILDTIRTTKDTEYEGPHIPYDPYKERGLSPSDFH